MRVDYLLRGPIAGMAVMAFVLSACVSPNDVAMDIGGQPKAEEGKTALNLRSMQTRRFDTFDERRLLRAATQTLQDLGYTVTESSLKSGVLVGAKERDAEESGQIAGQVMLTLIFAALGTYHSPTWDASQKIVVTLTTSPVENSNQSDVRVSFDRRLTNNYGDLWRSEVILDPRVYQEFFEKFSQGVFLEGQKL